MKETIETNGTTEGKKPEETKTNSNLQQPG